MPTAVLIFSALLLAAAYYDEKVRGNKASGILGFALAFGCFGGAALLQHITANNIKRWLELKEKLLESGS